MAKLTKQYIKNHENLNHTFAEFGKLMFDIAMANTKNIVGDGEEDKVNFDVSFEVKPYEPKDCIKVSVKDAAGNWWSIHQSLDKVEPGL
jgi:hypothetical protein